MKKLIFLLVLISFTIVHAQEAYLELLRQDLKTQKVAIITQAMQLSDENGAKFWPIYREFDNESMKLGDTYIILIKKYAENYQNMTEKVADELVNGVMDYREDRLKLLKKYYKKIKKVLSATTAAKFVQIQNQINMMIDLQVTSQLPLLNDVKLENTQK